MTNLNSDINLLSKRKSISIVILGCFMVLLFFYHWDFATNVLQFQYMSSDNYETNVFTVQKGMKYILLWSDPNRAPLSYWGQGQTEFINQRCKVNNCYITSNRSLLPNVSQFDAVAFHGPEITRYVQGPSVRSPHQKYVYASKESSHYYPICDERYDSYFNWTWTYRLDSDGYFAYITVRNITGDIIGPNRNMHWIPMDSMQPINVETKVRLEKKNKAAAWFVSNCHSKSKREEFVDKLQNELKKYGLEIDIFGACKGASKQCPRTKTKECLRIIQEEYFFYLALENSFSEDYVTEKLLTALQNYAVPVVFGAANYTRFMPDGIYLHSGKLTPYELAREMNDIIQDKERYYSFFKWRNHYSYHEPYYEPETNAQCRICEMLHDETIMKNQTIYKDFRKWWNNPGACSSLFG